MKIFLKLIAATIAIICIVLPVSAKMFFAVDDVNVVTAQDSVLMLEAEKSAGFKFAVLMTNTYFSSEWAAGRFAQDFYDKNIGETVSGVLLLINLHEDTYDYIYANGAASRIISDRRIDLIFDDIWDDLVREDYEQAIVGFVNSVLKYVELGEISVAERIPTMLFVFLVVDVIIIVGLIIAVKSSYKMSRVKCASDYLDRQSVRYYQKSDTYIRTYVTKVRINTNSSGSGGRSGGGGSRSGGGGSRGGSSGGGRRR